MSVRGAAADNRSSGHGRSRQERAMLIVVGIVIGLVAGGLAAVLAVRLLGTTSVGAAQRERRLLLEQAERDADTTRREAEIASREEAVKLRAEVEQEVRERRSQTARLEERLHAKEEEIERRMTELTRREQGLSDRETHVKELQEELKQARDGELAELERVSGMTLEEAKRYVLDRSEELIRHELARHVRQEEEAARNEAKRRARNLVADALQRVAASHAAETTVSVVEIIIDDTPQAVVLSSFDGVRREVAKITLAKLIEDGRIHPARIEEMYYQSKAELEEHILRAGEQAVFEANCGELHEDLVKILGRLKYRTSYGQNVLRHTLEVVHLAGIMAAELEASTKTAKRAALLHDLGKAMTHEVEGSHAGISAQLARRYGESQGVVHAIEAHHYEVQPQTVEAVLLIAADAISASRPGARGESLESYIKRLSALEEIAMQKGGVEKASALQAGREIRVMVKPAEIDDDGAVLLSHEIAREIEDQLEYPGQVKVTVIRESRAVEVAK